MTVSGVSKAGNVVIQLLGPVVGEIKLPSINCGFQLNRPSRKGSIALISLNGRLVLRFTYLTPVNAHDFDVVKNLFSVKLYPNKLYIQSKSDKAINCQFIFTQDCRKVEELQKIADKVNEAVTNADERDIFSPIASKISGSNTTSNVSSPPELTKKSPLFSSNSKSVGKSSSFYGSADEQYKFGSIGNSWSNSRNESPWSKSKAVVVPEARNVQTRRLFTATTNWNGATVQPSTTSASSDAASLSANAAAIEERKNSSSAEAPPLDGFVNLGNTCYMNAVLQALLAVPSFQCDLMRPDHVTAVLDEEQPECRARSALEEFAEALNEDKENEDKENEEICSSALTLNRKTQNKNTKLYRVLVKLLADKIKRDKGLCREGSLDSRRQFLQSLKQAVASVERQFDGTRQNDAHEFLSLSLDILREEVIRITKRTKSVIPNGSSMTPPQIECPVNSNFQLTIKHTIQCTNCQLSQDHLEQMLILSVNLPEAKEKEGGGVTPMSLVDAVKAFFVDEMLEYRCDVCGHREARLKHRIVRLPKVLIIHLKRYKVQELDVCKDFTSVIISKHVNLSHTVDAAVQLPDLSRKPRDDFTLDNFQLNATPSKFSDLVDRLDHRERQLETRDNEEGQVDSDYERSHKQDEGPRSSVKKQLFVADSNQVSAHKRRKESCENKEPECVVSGYASAVINSHQGDKILKTPVSKLELPDSRPPSAKKPRSAQLSWSAEAQKLSPVRRNTNVRFDSNSDLGPRGRDHRELKLLEEDVLEDGDGDDGHGYSVGDDYYDVTPRKSQRLIKKQTEKTKQQREMFEMLRNSSEKKKRDGKLSKDMFCEDDSGDFVDLTEGDGENWNKLQRRRSRGSDPNNNSKNNVFDPEEDDDDLRKALLMSMRENEDSEAAGYEADLEMALELSRREIASDQYREARVPADCLDISDNRGEDDDDLKGTVLSDSFLNGHNQNSNAESQVAEVKAAKTVYKDSPLSNVVNYLNIPEEPMDVDVKHSRPITSPFRHLEESDSFGDEAVETLRSETAQESKAVPRDELVFGLEDSYAIIGATAPSTPSNKRKSNVTSTPSTEKQKHIAELEDLFSQNISLSFSSPCSEDNLNGFVTETEVRDEVFDELNQRDLLHSACEKYVPFPSMEPNPIEDILNDRVDEIDVSLVSSEGNTDKCKEEGVENLSNNVIRSDVSATDKINNELSTSEMDIRTSSEKTQDAHLHDDENNLNEEFTYRLLSIVCHLGTSASGGHYVSDVYNPKTKSWSCFDDETVRNREEHKVLISRQKPGYIFFYMHQSLFPTESEPA